ncbi:MAG: Txe/YoeB family addiction module toxin [Chitinophagaceae bacterium]|nr:MAG: Txe/YoeB family addiction module toxin [Chitinophagaceae bacterium]
MEIELTDNAIADITYWKLNNQIKIIKRINALLENILSTPYTGIGKPEPLKFKLAGLWSRRINKEHRIVYRVYKNKIEVLSARYHYD